MGPVFGTMKANSYHPKYRPVVLKWINPPRHAAFPDFPTWKLPYEGDRHGCSIDALNGYLYLPIGGGSFSQVEGLLSMEGHG